MGKCIACNKEMEVVKTISAISQTNGKSYPIVFCRCGIGQTKVEGNYELELLKANADMYDDIEERIKIYYYHLYNHYVLRVNELLSFIEKQTSGKTLLELGANIGFTSRIAMKRGFKVETCELNPNMRKFEELIYHLHTNADFFKIEGKTFDVITMLHVLEHFIDPPMVIEKAQKLLNKEGVLFIEVPNVESDVAKRKGEYWSFYNPPDHTFHFSFHSLQLILERYGFEIIWHRKVRILEDFKRFDLLPKKFRNKIISLLYHNPFYYPKYYPAKNGSIIQLMARKK